MHLFERETLLAQLVDCLAAARAGHGRLVCLEGEAGVGKTALAQAFAAQARGRVRVLWGACEDLSTAEPLGPLYDIARDAGWRFAGDAGTSRLALFSEALGVIAKSPTLAVIEDVHWSDDATLDFVRYCGRRIADKPIVLLLTARNEDDSARERLRRALVDVPAAARLRFDVPRLSATAVETLARGAQRDGESLYAATGGNAFFVTEALRAVGVPANVRDAVLQRAARLSLQGRHALEAASIFPRRVEPWLLTAVGGADAAAGAEECLSQGMLVADADAFAFRHELARRAVEDAVPVGQRHRLNRFALDALRERMPNAVARLAHHAEAADDAELVSHFTPLAGAEAARVGAHREAARHYGVALARAERFAPEARAELFEKWAFELHLIGRMDDAIGAQQSVLALRRAAGDARGEGDALRWLSRLSYLAGDRVTAERLAHEAVGVLERLASSPELAMAYANESHLAMLNDDCDSAVHWGEKAIPLAERFGREDIVCATLNNVGTALQWTDEARGRATLERSLALALELNDQMHAARAYTNAGCLEANLRRTIRAHKTLAAGIAYCAERDLDTWRDYMSGWLAEQLLKDGRFDEAAQTALGVLMNPNASRLVRFPAAAALARTRLRRGDPDADSPFREVRSFLAAGMESQRFLHFATIVAERAWIAGDDVGEALDVLRQAAPIAVATKNTWMMGEVAYWRRKFGDLCDLPDGAAFTYKLQFAGDWDAAAAAWAALPAPFEEALALLDGDEAAQRRALKILDDLGATAAAERARADLRARGVKNIARGPRASTRANAAGLTKRQMDVLGLIDRGLSNAEIAEKLFVSAKTVDHHVSAILAKLEAGSRGEAVAIARDAGLLS